MEQVDTKAPHWRNAAVVVSVVIVAAAIWWSLHHPFGANWDETEYLDELAIDRQRLRAGNLLRLVGRLLLKSWGRPPAYRILALPVVSLFQFHPFTARLTTVVCSCLAGWFIYLAAKRIASQTAGAVAALVFCLCPQVVSASIWFSTEGPLYLATAATLYYLFAMWTEETQRRSNWIGLGLALALGLLSKASFILIGLPVVMFAIYVGRLRKLEFSVAAPLRKSLVIALAIAGPWWVLNIRSSSSYAGYARDFVRDSLGRPSLATWERWFGTVIQGLLGYGLGILVILIAIAVLWLAVRGQKILTPLQRLAIGTCACAASPIVLEQLSGTNHLLRHITPAIIPLAIAIGVLVDSMGWTRSKAGIAVISLCLGAQLFMISVPVLIPNKRFVDSGMVNGTLPWRIMARSEQWDWERVKNIGEECGLRHPKISFLGGGRAFNQPAIQYPWATEGQVPDVVWLWHYEEGPINWDETMIRVDQSDIVITAPAYVGQVSNRENLDNENNAELAGRLSGDSHFQKPITYLVGRFEPVSVLIFVNKSLTCHLNGQEQVVYQSQNFWPK